MKVLSFWRNRKTIMFLACALFTITLASPASGTEYIYTYTGQSFTTWTGSDTSSQETNISGYFILTAQLTAGMTEMAVPPFSYSFTDGNPADTLTGSNSSITTFDIGTDGTGAINSWEISLASSPSLTQTLFTENDPVLTLDQTATLAGSDILGSADNSSPGTWACTYQIHQEQAGFVPPPCPAVASTPEPSGLVLFGTGLLGLLGVLGVSWHRKQLV